MSNALTYAAVTPARDEAHNLGRLATCLSGQTAPPDAWIVVDDGSVDDTSGLARTLEGELDWVRTIAAPGAEPTDQAAEPSGRQTGRDVVAFAAGLDALPARTDVVVKLDADVSFDADYFERLLGEFEAEPSLGIASGLCYEEEDGEWRPQFATGAHARGATRAYRWPCLEDVLPLECHIGWDGIDEVKASLAGWTTGTIPDLPFFHHRRLGQRDGRRRGWVIQGLAAHYVGYRPSYLIMRSLHHARRDPAALSMLTAYFGAALRRHPRCPERDVRASLRRSQRLRELPARRREASGRRG